MTIIQNVFDDRVISRGLWRARSPDLNPCDFYICGTLKSKVYANILHSLEELQTSGTELEPFRGPNCVELLDMSSGDVQPAR